MSDIKSLIKVEEKLLVPSVAILDDEPEHTNILVRDLKKENFNVVLFTNKDSLLEYIEKHIIDVILIDIALLGQIDTSGLKVAETCVQQCPDALRICISRPSIARLDPIALMDAMNPSFENGGIRLFEAFGDKFRPHEIVKLIKLIRAQHYCSDNVQCFIDEDLSTYIESNFEVKIQNKKNIAEPARQFINIVKQLAFRQYMAEAREIHLRNIGTGRSRTVVCSMDTYYGEDDHPYRSVIKLGYPILIDQEINNYSKYVPKCLNHGKYPQLEGKARSRDFAGLAYGRIGLIENQAISPTLRDELRNLKTITEKDASKIIKKIFSDFSTLETPKEPTPIITLKERYTQRFHALKKIKDIEVISNKCLKQLVKDNLIREEKPGEIWVFSSYGNRKVNSLENSLEGQINWQNYGEAIVHGDFHLDNIITPRGLESESYFIDFSHTSWQHCFLDHIILELGARQQLGDIVFKDAKDNIPTSLENIIKMECILLDIAQNKQTEIQLPTQLRNIINLIIAIRGEAASRWSREPVNNYFGGLALTFSAALRLPSDENVKQLFRIWFTVVSTLNFSIYEDAESKKYDLSLWNYREEKTEDKRVSTTIDYYSKELQDSFIQLIRNQNQIYKNLITKIEENDSDILELKRFVQSEFPEISEKLENIISALSNIQDDPQIQAGLSIGFPFLMIQLSKKASLPRELESKAESIWNKLIGKKK